MSYQVLARKWRPQNFNDLVGQTHVVKTLVNALDTNRLHHAYLFSGTRGVGKTTLARILARCLNCELGVSSQPCGECHACVSITEGRFTDLIEVDAASRSKVDETRDLMDNVQYAPSSGRYKVYLIDEVHMFSNHSFNALLKTLEEPPPHVKFLLATTEPRKLPITILSRCLQFNLVYLTIEQISRHLRLILEHENIDSSEQSLNLIADAADGSMRDALSLLDQAIAFSSGKLDEQSVRNMLGSIDRQDITTLIDALISNDASVLFQTIERIAAYNPDYDAVLAELLSRLHEIAIAQVLPDRAEDIDDSSYAVSGRTSKEDIQLFYQIGLSGRRDMVISPDPRTGFEMTMIRMLAFRPAKAPGSIRSGAVKPAAPASGNPVAEQTKTTADPIITGTAVMQPNIETAMTVNANWQSIIDEMALAGLVKELAGHCVLKEHTNDKVHLVLTPAQEHLLNTSQKDRLQKAITTRFGKQVKLVISVDAVAEETPSEQRIRAEKERQENAVKAFVDDPDVNSIIDSFDASMNMNSIRPR
jgi:DNA polymerase-3 subunit gamma/tau